MRPNESKFLGQTNNGDIRKRWAIVFAWAKDLQGITLPTSAHKSQHNGCCVGGGGGAERWIENDVNTGSRPSAKPIVREIWKIYYLKWSA